MQYILIELWEKDQDGYVGDKGVGHRMVATCRGLKWKDGLLWLLPMPGPMGIPSSYFGGE